MMRDLLEEFGAYLAFGSGDTGGFLTLKGRTLS